MLMHIETTMPQMLGSPAALQVKFEATLTSESPHVFCGRSMKKINQSSECRPLMESIIRLMLRTIELFLALLERLGDLGSPHRRLTNEDLAIEYTHYGREKLKKLHRSTSWRAHLRRNAFSDCLFPSGINQAALGFSMEASCLSTVRGPFVQGVGLGGLVVCSIRR